MDLPRQMVRSALVHQCACQGALMEKRVCGVVGISIIYAEFREELNLINWDVDNTCLLLKSPSTWMEFPAQVDITTAVHSYATKDGPILYAIPYVFSWLLQHDRVYP